MEELVKDETGKWISRSKALLKSLPNYPWLPCPICGGTESCDDTVLERARKAIPGLYIPQGSVN